MPPITRRTSAVAGLLVAPIFFGVIVLVTLLERDFRSSLGWSLTDRRWSPRSHVHECGEASNPSSPTHPSLAEGARHVPI
jgi:hypothetical protein